MNRYAFVTALALLVLSACAAPEANTEAQAPLDVEMQAAAPTRTPLLVRDGLFIGVPRDFVLPAEALSGLYLAADAGTESDNNGVLENRADGEAYLEATGRISGYRIQFNRSEEVDTPSYVLNVVNIYETTEGAQLVLSREWHADVWSLIDGGQLTHLPDIEGIDVPHIAWVDPNGGAGVEFIYRNIYVLITAPGDGADTAAFVTDLARTHYYWIVAGEQ
jgi:hypothetical protein